jgi:predicted NAD-dependent protein-ADP-ribosyltransferase YbiA (DUF1768 family)
MPRQQPFKKEELLTNQKELVETWSVENPLSNCYLCPVLYNGTIYDSAEHAYHCQKFDPEKHSKIIEEIMSAPSGPEAKLAYQKHKKKAFKLTPSEKLRLMLDIVRHKVSQNSKVWEALTEIDPSRMEVYEEDPDDSRSAFPPDTFWSMTTDQETGITYGSNYAAKIYLSVRRDIMNGKITPQFWEN